MIGTDGNKVLHRKELQHAERRQTSAREGQKNQKNRPGEGPEVSTLS